MEAMPEKIAAYRVRTDAACEQGQLMCNFPGNLWCLLLRLPQSGYILLDSGVEEAQRRVLAGDVDDYSEGTPHEAVQAATLMSKAAVCVYIR